MSADPSPKDQQPAGANTNVAEAPQLAGAHSPIGLRCLRLSAVCARLSCGETFLRSEISAGRFPAGFKIGQRAVAWLESDLEAWIADRAAKRVMFKP